MHQTATLRSLLWIILLTVFALHGIRATTGPVIGLTDTSYWLEAECADIGSRWTKVLSDSAAGGAYVETQFVSLTGPPDDVAENLVRFTVANTQPGPYQLFARVNAPTRTNDSYWLRINNGAWQEIKQGLRIGQGFQWVQLTTAELVNGTNTVDFTYRENSTRLDKILLTNNADLKPTGLGIATQECQKITSPPVDKGLFWLEAECAIVGSTWAPARDPAASNGIVLTSTRSGASRFMPPVDLPSNLIRFVIEDPAIESGRFSIWFRANIDNGEMFWVRYNDGPWSLRQPARIRGKGLAWAGYSVPRGALVAGTNTIDIAYLSAGFQLDKLLLTKYSIVPSFLGGPADSCPFTPSPEPTDRNTFSLEAECATVGDQWSVESDAAASSDAAVVVRGATATDTPPTDEPANLLRFTIAAADSGSYNLFARVKTPDNLSDSYWIRTNGGPWYEWDRGFEFVDAYSWQQTPVAFALQEGANTLDFAFREDGAVLDKIYLTLTASELTGDTFGDPATNCSAAAQPSAPAFTAVDDWAGAELSLFPNPVSSRLTFQWESPFAGPVRMVITDAHGRQLRQATLQKAVGWARQALDLRALPPGVYYLRLLENERHTTRRFIKQ
ncbi:hypothetical protein LEM8419_02434 [Neolewinella maritima]|uniref:Secretion system C-terminal sorting domain-containing protein n=1 Tax=Neolewinella maritima TaxID=1383882 RepID=A0ABM9B3M9_9BACT|nr:T9SS type A sorting domain-containing protein [Neolewinella maritima]CAH1001531.1 hypothetical protein LEM8419_02434 [Neolewinella maritima]